MRTLRAGAKRKAARQDPSAAWPIEKDTRTNAEGLDFDAAQEDENLLARRPLLRIAVDEKCHDPQEAAGKVVSNAVVERLRICGEEAVTKLGQKKPSR